jgi:GH15 family glucan-1,4-alpha-glucosidase
MYSLDEVLPFIYSEIEESPSVKDGIFENDNNLEEFHAQINDLMHEPSNGEYSLTIPSFSGVDDATSEERSFEAKRFTFNVTKSLKEHDDYCEGKAWSHYDTHMIDVETQQKYILTACYYETNQDLIGIYVEKVKQKVAKPKKVKTMFVAVKPTPEDYHILGIFQSLGKAIEAQDDDTVQIEEVPINCNLEPSENYELPNMITGALNVFNLEGNPI